MTVPVTNGPSSVPSVDQKRAVALVMRMMAIPGKCREENRVARFIVDKLRAAGLREAAIQTDKVHTKRAARGEQGNLIVKFPGSMRGRRRLLMAHMDTVPLCVGSKPVRRGNMVTSGDPNTALGADDRAGASVVLNTALEVLRRDLPHPPLTFLWSVQEELGGRGARFVSRSMLGNPSRCFNWDGFFSETVWIGATGADIIDIKVQGIASHAGVQPEQGVSAAIIAAKAIADLEEHGWHGLVVKGKNSGTSNLGAISGGEATNVVMPDLQLRAEVRSHSPRFRKKMLEEFERAFRRACRSTRNEAGDRGAIEFQPELKYESFRLAETEPVVQDALAALESVDLQGQVQIVNGGLDANWLNNRGMPTVSFGCGQRSPHTVDETLDLDEYLKACKVCMALATRL